MRAGVAFPDRGQPPATLSSGLAAYYAHTNMYMYYKHSIIV